MLKAATAIARFSGVLFIVEAHQVLKRWGSGSAQEAGKPGGFSGSSPSQGVGSVHASNEDK